MQYELFQLERFSFFSLSSGSCGNCYYLGNSRYGILIDAGIGPRVIRKRLAENGVDLSSIMAVLITHDHYDHIKSAGYLGEKLHIPVYATREVHRGISNSPLIRHSLNGSSKYIKKKGTLFRLKISALLLSTCHTTVSIMQAIFFEFGNNKLTLVTDVGAITDEVAYYICKANHLVIESNYDEEMLRNGCYPYHLKRRITSGEGHLSNRETAEFLANNYSSELRNIWLCHLSGDNNNPTLAYETVERQLSQRGIEVGRHVALHVLERNVLSNKIDF